MSGSGIRVPWLVFAGVVSAGILIVAAFSLAPSGLWASVPLLLAALWSFLAFHLSPVGRSSTSASAASPAPPASLHVFVLAADEPSDRVVATVASLSGVEFPCSVSLVGGPAAEFLASSLGVGFVSAEGLAGTLAGVPADDFVFQLSPGAVVRPAALAAAVELGSQAGSVCVSSVPVFEGEDAYSPPGSRKASSWWLANALSRGSRLRPDSSQLVRASVFAAASGSPARGPLTVFDSAVLSAGGVFSLCPEPVVHVSPSFDADSFWEGRYSSVRREVRQAWRASFASSGRVSAFASFLHLARGISFALALLAVCLVAVFGVEVSSLPTWFFFTLLAVPVALRSFLVSRSVSSYGPEPASGLSVLSSGVYEGAVSFMATVFPRLSNPAWLVPRVLLSFMVFAWLCAALGAFGYPQGASGPRFAVLVFLVGFAAAACFSIVRCSMLRRSGRVTSRLAWVCFGSLDGEQVATVDVSSGGALLSVHSSRVFAVGDVFMLSIEDGPADVPAVVVRQFEGHVSVATSPDRASQLRWASWVASFPASAFR